MSLTGKRYIDDFKTRMFNTFIAEIRILYIAVEH